MPSRTRAQAKVRSIFSFTANPPRHLAVRPTTSPVLYHLPSLLLMPLLPEAQQPQPVHSQCSMGYLLMLIRSEGTAAPGEFCLWGRRQRTETYRPFTDGHLSSDWQCLPGSPPSPHVYRTVDSQPRWISPPSTAPTRENWYIELAIYHRLLNLKWGVNCGGRRWTGKSSPVSARGWHTTGRTSETPQMIMASVTYWQ